MSCLRKYLTKAALFLFLIILLISASAAIVCNIILARSKNTILEASNKYFSQKVSIRNLLYLPPCFIVITDTSMAEASEKKENIISVPQAWIRLSLTELIARRRAVISGISLYGLKADYPRLSGFLKENFERIMDFIKHLPKQDVKISIKEAEFWPAQNDNGAGYTAASFFLKIRGNSVSARGAVSRNYRGTSLLRRGSEIKRPEAGVPLRFVFKGVLAQGGISIENLELTRENLYAKFWGDSTGNILRLNGFGFANTLFTVRDGYARAAFNVAGRIKDALAGRAAPRYPAIDLSKVNLYILDINCRINLLFPRVLIERLSFSLNNNPVSIKGSISFSQPVGIGLAISSNQAESGKAAAENLKKVDLRFQGVLENSVFIGNGMLSLDFMKKKKASPPLERLKLGFKGLALNPSGYPRLKLSLKGLSLFCLTESNAYRMFLDGMNATVYLQNEKSKFIEFNSKLYGGSINGWGRVGLDTFPPHVSSAVRFRGVDANRLEGLLVHLSKVYGRMYGQAYFSSYPRLILNGGMVVENGYLRDFEFFKWLSETFTLPSLRKIDFTKLSSNFTVNDEGAGLRELKLGSQDVNLSGYFKLGADDLVSSKLSLALSRELLKESPKFAPLLRLADSGPASLAFNFQLSGVLDAMNFQWLSSDFKKDVQDAIPGFIERKIERSVEDLIESVQ